MSGWLDGFEDGGLIRRGPAGHPLRLGESAYIPGVCA